MFGLIYKVAQYFFTPSALNKGEKDQPPSLDDQEKHLRLELARVRREKAVLAERLGGRQDPSHELSGDGASEEE